jgi:hypothetical protein
MNKSPFKASISQIAEQIQPFHVMKILGEAKALEAAGKKIIHMEIGEPDFPSLPCVHEAATQAAALGLTHYTPTLGLPALRDKLSLFLPKLLSRRRRRRQYYDYPGFLQCFAFGINRHS